MHSCGSLQTDEQVSGDQVEPIYNISVLIQSVASKTYRERWMIEINYEWGSGKSVLVADDDDDDDDASHKKYCFKIYSRFFFVFIIINTKIIDRFKFNVYSDIKFPLQHLLQNMTKLLISLNELVSK